LAGGSLVVEMLAHHATEESARAAVEPYLKAWEIGHALNVGGEPEFRFEFVRAEIIDRDPPPPGTPQTIEASALIHTRAILSATASVERGSLPGAPTRFVLDADLETLWTRWRAYREGREPLQGMAYFVLTVLQMHDGWRAAGAHFGIDKAVPQSGGGGEAAYAAGDSVARGRRDRDNPKSR
jgi:hypothetical protein